LVIGGQVGQYACWRIILASQNNFSLLCSKNSDTIRAIIKSQPMSKKVTIFIVIVIVIVIALLAAAFFVWRASESNFEFTETTPPGFLAGQVIMGPFCPVERPGVPCPVPADAYSSRRVMVYQTDGKTLAAQKNLETDGHYSVQLAPSDYLVTISPAGIGQLPFKNATVKSNQTTKLDFDIDTGIR
jgi:hypothetical protein